MVLKYGKLNSQNKRVVKQLDPRARIEELKTMYRNATTQSDEGL